MYEYIRFVKYFLQPQANRKEDACITALRLVACVVTASKCIHTVLVHPAASHANHVSDVTVVFQERKNRECEKGRATARIERSCEVLVSQQYKEDQKVLATIRCIYIMYTYMYL